MTKRGFTLIETLVYLALFVLLVFGALSSLYAMQGASARIIASATITDEAQFVLHTIRWYVANSSTVTTPLPDSVDGMLVLTMSGGDVLFDRIGASLVRSHAGTNLPVTGSVQVSDLSFVRSPLSVDGSSSFIISFSMTARATTGQLMSEHFTDTLYLPAPAL